MCTNKAIHHVLASVKANFVPKVYWAIENGQYGTLERLFEHGIDVDMRLDTLNFLQVKDLFGSFQDNAYMKAHGVFEDLELEAEVSPLAWAVIHGQDSMVEYLLDHGADIERASTMLCTCWCQLVYCPHDLPKRPEIRPCSPLPSLGDFPDWTPLHHAICHGKASTAQLLLQRGANARCVMDDSVLHPRTTEVNALHVATCRRLHETANYLLDKGLVDINAQLYDGATALHMAYLAGDYDLVNRFLDKGADINLAFNGESGPWTIFSMACADRLFLRALEYLRRGADPHFDLADQYEDFTVMRLIYFDESGLDEWDIIDMRKLERAIIAGGRPSRSNT